MSTKECELKMKAVYQKRGEYGFGEYVGIIKGGCRTLTFAHVRQAQRCVWCTF